MAVQVEQGVARVVKKIAANAPEGWTEAVLASTEGLFGLSISGRYTVVGAHPRPCHLSGTVQDLQDLMAAVGARRGWERTRLEIRCRPSGEFSLVASRDVVSRLHGERPSS